MELEFFQAMHINEYVRPMYKAEPVPELTSKEIHKLWLMPTQLYPNWKENITSETYGETGITAETDGGQIRLDFNFGLRLDIPPGNWHVKISDADTEKVFFDKDVSDTRIISVEKYYIHWQIDVSLNNKPIFSHTMELEGQDVLIYFHARALGDTLALLPHCREFKKRHNCNLKIFVHEYLRELVGKLYPDIPQVDKLTYDYYATFYMIFFATAASVIPADSRTTPMERIGGNILGTNTLPVKPVYKPNKARIIKEPYVCIGVQASGTFKSWLYPNGWDILVNYLKNLGWRVLCIDKNAEETNYLYTVKKPDEAEDFTGDIPLVERANMLYYADFFVGLGSGLSWLAYAVDCPVVMICGFTKDWCEFYTPYRVADRIVCNGCWNDINVNAKDKICPYYRGTEREMECQKKITPRQVIDAVERLIIDEQIKVPALNKE